MATSTLVLIPVCTLVLMAVALQISRLIRGWTQSSRGQLSQAERRVELALLDDKERLLLAIRDLTFEHEMGKVSEEDYTALKGRLEREAVAVIAQLEALP